MDELELTPQENTAPPPPEVQPSQMSDEKQMPDHRSVVIETPEPLQPQEAHIAQMPDAVAWAAREVELQEARAERERMFELHREGKRAYVIFGWALVLFLIAQVVFPIGIGMLLDSFAPWIILDIDLSMIITYASMYLLGFPLLLLMIGDIPNRMPSRPVEADCKLGAGQILSLYAILSAVSTIVVLTADTYLGTMDYEQAEPVQEIIESAANPWLMFFFAVIVAPVMEELVFRLLPYRKLGGYGMRYYVIWTSVAFGLFHLNLVQSVYAGIMGAVFAVVMYRTGSVKYSILLHFMVNLTSAFGLGRLVLDAGDTVLMIYGFFNLAICVIGFVLLIRYLMKKFFTLKDPYEKKTIQNWRGAFLTGGYIFFVVACLGLIAIL